MNKHNWEIYLKQTNSYTQHATCSSSLLETSCNVNMVTHQRSKQTKFHDHQQEAPPNNNISHHKIGDIATDHTEYVRKEKSFKLPMGRSQHVPILNQIAKKDILEFGQQLQKWDNHPIENKWLKRTKIYRCLANHSSFNGLLKMILVGAVEMLVHRKK